MWRVLVRGPGRALSREARQKFDFSAFWEAPYRPLFLAAFLAAFLSLAWWPLGVRLGLPAPGLQPVVLWHVHELIFGFAGAAVGGYLLTALPGWTSRPPLRGWGLKALVFAWILARVTTAMATVLPPALPLVFNAAYFLGLAAIICYQVIAAGAYRKLGFVGAVLALGLGEALFLSGALAGRVLTSLYLAQTLLIGFAVLMTGVAAWAIPAFTRNWMAQSGRAGLKVREMPLPRAAAQGLLGLALALRLAGYADAASAALIAAAMAMLWTMSGWRSSATLSNPLLAALHLAYLWVPVGILTLGIIGLGFVAYPMADAFHTITIGAMSGLIMAISGRAASYTASGDMRAGAGFVVGVLAIWITTWLRLSAPFFPARSADIHFAAALLWDVGWLVFIIGFMPALTGPVRRPVLSGRKHAAWNDDPTPTTPSDAVRRP